MMDFMSIGNMDRLFAALWDRDGDRVILKYMEDRRVATMTAARFAQQAEQAAAVLAARKLQGKHIGIMGANRVRWLAAFCAVYRIGGVAVLLSPDLNARELSQRMEQADVTCLLYDRALGETAREAVKDGSAALLCLDDLQEDMGCSPEPAPERHREDLACILFTSGTTATAKAVMLSHGAMIAGVCHGVIGKNFHAQLAILPLHHIAGIASVLNTWYLGAVVCLGQTFKHLYRYLSEMKPDYMLAVPSLLQALLKKLKHGGPNGQLLGWNLRLLGCGGARFQPEVIRLLHGHNIRILQSYGATEAGGLGFDWEMTEDCRDTIGKPCPEIETKIVDGELWLRSPSVMMGYYKDPEATAQVLRDGWYATGDLCQQDDEWYLRLLGRKKNVIILSNGENVSPEEIEAALQACPDVDEVLVGVEEELICATIFSEKGTESGIRKFVECYNSNVPYYKQVQKLHFWDRPFEKTEVGKMIRQSVLGVNSHDH